MRALSRVAIFECLHLSQLQQLVDVLKEKSFKKDEVIIGETSGDTFYILSKGSCDCIRDGEVIMNLGEYDYFGEDSLLNDFVGSSKIVAKTNVEVCYAQKNDFENILGSLQTLIESEKKKRDALHQKYKEYFSQHNLENVAISAVVSDEQDHSFCLGRFKSDTLTPDITTYDFIISRIKCNDTSNSHLKVSVEISQLISINKTSVELSAHFLPLYFGLFKGLNVVHLVYDTVLSGNLHTIAGYYPLCKVPVDACRYIAACASSALHYLHSHGIIYRNIQPESVHVTKDGRLIFVDYILSKVLQCQNGKICEKTYTLCGTADYFAPEMLLFAGYGAEVDYWALGVLLYELILGNSNPFSGKESSSMSDDSIFAKILSLGSTDFPEIIFPEDIDNDMKAIISAFLAPAPSRRLGSGPSVGNISESIRNHVYFSGFDWENLQSMQSPLFQFSQTHVEHIIEDGETTTLPLLALWDGQERSLADQPQWVREL